MATSPYFSHVHISKNVSVLPSLNSQGNLIAGATTRLAVGFVLNPFSVLKARFEVRQVRHWMLPLIEPLQSNIYMYESLPGAFISVVRLGPSELLKGFLASSLRDGPYSGIFVLFYEGIKRETC
jgi:solute carrier family 25 protein 38